MNTTRGQAGFTTLELLIGLTVTVGVLLMLVEANSASRKLSSTVLTLGRIEESSGRATMSIASELRWAQPDTMLVTPQNGSDRIDFSMAEGYDGAGTVWSTPITYLYEPSLQDWNGNGAADEGRIVRLQNGARRVVCRKVQSGGLSIQQDGDRVDVQLSVFGLDSDKRLVEGSARFSVTLVNRFDP